MTPFIKRNLLICISTIFFIGLIYSLNKLVPILTSRIEHLEFIAISLIMMISLVVMLFWNLLGVFGGLASFLVALLFLYKSLTALDPYYWSVLIMVFFLNSFIGYFIYRKNNIDNQKYTVDMEKLEEDINLVTNHLKNRNAEISAMNEKIAAMLKLKMIADNLSLSLSDQDIIKTVSEETYKVFGGQTRVMLFIADEAHNELSLSYTAKGKNRNIFTTKKGSIFDRWVLRNMKSLLVKDINRDFRFSTSELEEKDDAVSLIIKPLIVESSIRGLLRVDSPHENAFGQHELRLLDIVGELATVALENARLYQKTKELAIRDSLTGLYVHRYFMERLEEEVRRALHSRPGATFALLMLDIDNFKDFNDEYGHISGDAILRNIAQVLKSKAKGGDIVARYGGEEFAFLVLDSDKVKASKLADDIKNKIQNSPIELRRKKCAVTVSIGIAVFPFDARLREDLIWAADQRLYRAKKEGKNIVCLE